MELIRQAATAAAALKGANATFVATAVNAAIAAADPVQAVNAVSIKLARFNPARCEYWFATAEAEFNLRQPPITADRTKFSYVLASLEGDTIDRVIDLVRAPPANDAYTAIKNRLLEAFGRTPIERCKALLDWPGLGDGTPSSMLSKMLATLPGGDDPNTNLVKTLFLRQLPSDVQDHLGGMISLPIRELARNADRFFASSGSRLNPSSSSSFISMAEIDAVSARNQRGSIGGTTGGDLCFFHAKYGKEARKCKMAQNGPCSMTGVPLAKPLQKTGNANTGHQ